jgi:hypothetical protein
MYLSSGEPLRDEVSHGTKLRKQVEAINKSGVLVIPVLRCRLLFLAYNEYRAAHFMQDLSVATAHFSECSYRAQCSVTLRRVYCTLRFHKC